MEDALFIANNMRQADREELQASFGMPPELILPQAIGRPRVLTWEADGKPVAIGGVDPSIPFVGVVWMVATDDIVKHRMKFLRQCKPVLDQLHKEYPILTNMVDARNSLHIRWLKWLGFVFTQKIEKWGAQSVPFYEFARCDTSCVQ